MSLPKAYVDKEAFSRRLSELIRAFEPCPDKYDAVVAIQSVFNSFPYTTIPADHIGDVNENVRPVVRGKWSVQEIYKHEMSYGTTAYEPVYKCSACGNLMESYLRYDEPIMPEDADFPRYCPNCGADMREES